MEIKDFIEEYDEKCKQLGISPILIFHAATLIDVMPDKIMDGLFEAYLRKDAKVDRSQSFFEGRIIEDISILKWLDFLNALDSSISAKLCEKIGL